MSPPQNEIPALDPAALDELRACDDDGSLIAELIDLYLKDTPRRLALLREAHDAGDAAGVSREAHALKGSCGQFGATTLTECCRELEHLGRRGTLEGAEPMLARIATEFVRVKSAMELLRAG
ncbi:MAG TPA: Hpt domain-containing protein [Planctomycetota bacterium]|nr:Hpt domain-containing protein [Planctomycetota bacterium]